MGFLEILTCLINILKFICWIVIFSFSGCVSTRIDYVEPEKLKQHNVYRIAVVYMKDGNIHNIYLNKSKLKLNYKNLGDVIIYKTESGVSNIIKINDVDKLKIEIMENDVLATSLIIAGSLLLATLIFLMIFLPFSHFNATG